jgi:hypothetical protein
LVMSPKSTSGFYRKGVIQPPAATNYLQRTPERAPVEIVLAAVGCNLFK